MNLRNLMTLILFALLAFPLGAQTIRLTADDLRPLEERITVLEREVARFKDAYARLDELFHEAIGLLDESRRADAEFTAAVAGTARAARTVEAAIDRAVAESREVIEYLKTKVAERPTLLVTGEAGWHILFGASAGVSLAWEPLPWLGLKVGAEVWYTDAFRPSFPIALTLRFGLP